MKRVIFLLAITLSVLGCGSSTDPDFSGTWDGSFTSLSNRCPFSVASDINPLFPMRVDIDQNQVFTVTAVDGSVAVGGQGAGESVSFLAQSQTFGRYGSSAPYTCASTISSIGFLDVGAPNASVTLTIAFKDCITPADPKKKKFSCAAIYYGDATKKVM